MQTNNAMKQKNNKTILLALILVLLMTFAFLGMLSHNPSTAFANGTVEDKAYRYNISKENNLFVLKGFRENLQEYVLTNSALNINDIINLIEEDRKLNASSKADVEITFNNLDLGNSTISFQDGNYTLKGSATFANISANPCVVIQNNAYVTFGGLNLTNQAYSSLIEVNNASLDINSCSLNSNQEVLIINGNSVVNVFGSVLMTENSNVITAINQSTTNKPQIKIGLNSRIITDASSPAINIQNANTIIQTCEIKALKSDYALINQGEGLRVVGTPTFVSIKNAFSTNMFFSTEYNGDYYSGNGLNVFYSGQIAIADVAIVINPSTDLISKLNMLNSGVALRNSYLSIYLSKQFSVNYNTNCSDASVKNALPKDSNKYFNLDEVQVQYMDLNVREHFEFLGWAKTAKPNQNDIITSGNLNIEGKDLNLYAIWKPITYSISYSGMNGISNNNPTQYNYENKITLNAPSKDYYDFVGWQIIGVSGTHSTLSLPFANLQNIELTPIFKLSEYAINYVNLSQNQIAGLGLKTKYTIQDADLHLNAQNYLMQGYSFYGVFSNPELTNSFEHKVINFAPNAVNDFGFVAGQTLNVYVSIKEYHNGQGSGESENPYIIENAEQFKTLITGKKLNTQNAIYIRLANDIEINYDDEFEFKSLNNFNIDGNNKSLLVKKLIQYSLNSEKILSIFPRLNNCELKNINIKNAENGQKLQLQENTSNQNIQISLLVHNLVSSLLTNVQNSLNVQTYINSSSNNTQVKISGMVGISVSSILENVRFSGEIILKSQNVPSTIYACGLVCESQNSIILNSRFSGILSFESLTNQIQNNVCTYFAGVGILINSNLIINSASQGQIKCNANQNICILSAIAINLGKWNEINNCLSLSLLSIEKDGDLKDNQKQISCVWGIADNISLQNILCFTRENVSPVCVLGDIKQNSGIIEFTNLDYVNLIHLQKLELGLPNAKNTLNSYTQNLNINANLENVLTLKSWQSHHEDDPSSPGIFSPKLNLTIIDSKTNAQKTYVFAENNLPGYVFPIKEGYLFKNYSYDSEGKNVITDLSALKGDVVIYANYITFDDYVWQNFIWWLIGAIIILIALACFIVFCEMKKKLIFIFDGEVVHAEKIKINAKLPKVKGKEDILWFEDGNGNKPFTKTKMPFVWNELKLISFKDEVRIPLEKLYEQERIAKELLVLQKQKIKEQKQQIKAENKAKNKLDKQKERINKKQKAQNNAQAKDKNKEIKSTTKTASKSKNAQHKTKKSEQSNKKPKKKTVKEIENSGITIVKKEIKTLPKSTTDNNKKDK